MGAERVSVLLNHVSGAQCLVHFMEVALKVFVEYMYILLCISYMYIYIPQIYVLEQQERYTCYFITKNEDDNNSK